MKPGPLFKRKELWVPTWRGWLIGFTIFLATAFLLIKSTPKFLSPTAPVNARVLVVEGWMGEGGFEFTQALAKSNHYDLVLTAGGRIDNGFDEVTYGTYANLGVRRLRAMGYTGTNLTAVPSKDAPKDRTYHAALSVRDFLLKTPYRSVDLLSEGVHGRRSWFLYRKAFGPEFQVGVYTAPPEDFRLDRWWVKSAGVRNLISEAIAYVYARLFFQPAAYEAPPGLKVSPAPASPLELAPAFPLPENSSKSP